MATISFGNPNDNWHKRREDSEQDSMKTILITLAFVIMWLIIVCLRMIDGTRPDYIKIYIKEFFK